MALTDYKTALVTGASSGIGASLVEQLTDKGIHVHALARRQDRLEALREKTGCEIHVLDLRNTADISATLSKLDIDILVNNAGHGRGFAGLDASSPDDIDASIDTNVRAVYHLIHATLPGMIARDRGHIINIGSMAGLYSVPSAMYGGVKSAVHMLSRNLRLELQGKRIRVSEICPGRVTTEFYDVAVDDAGTRDKMKNSGVRELDPEDVAASITWCLDAPSHVNINLIELQPVEQTYGGSQFTPHTSS